MASEKHVGWLSKKMLRSAEAGAGTRISYEFLRKHHYPPNINSMGGHVNTWVILQPAASQPEKTCPETRAGRMD
jgi:hypothetical protein